jgi:hypothetical protein
MMERLMELPLYQKDPATCRYNPNVITKLIRSFRSHPKIIEFSNEAFYDGDLLAKALPRKKYFCLNSFIDFTRTGFFCRIDTLGLKLASFA